MISYSADFHKATNENLNGRRLFRSNKKGRVDHQGPQVWQGMVNPEIIRHVIPQESSEMKTVDQTLPKNQRQVVPVLHVVCTVTEVMIRRQSRSNETNINEGVQHNVAG